MVCWRLRICCMSMNFGMAVLSQCTQQPEVNCMWMQVWALLLPLPLLLEVLLPLPQLLETHVCMYWP